MYGQNTYHLPQRHESSIDVPVHLPNWNSFLLQNIFSVLETMPLHQLISLLNQPNLLNSIPMYELEYLRNGINLLYFSTACRTTFYFLLAYILQSFPAFQADEFDKRHVLLNHGLLFLFGSKENNLLMYMEALLLE